MTIPTRHGGGRIDCHNHPARGALAHSEPQRGTGRSDTDWLQPPAQEKGLASYVQTLRERLWLIVLAVVVTTGASILYVATATKTYEAEADILVTPVPPQSDLLSSLGLISQSADPVREIETVARFIDTNEVAAPAQKKMPPGIPEAEGTPRDLLDHISAEPVADSNIVAVTAKASTADAAAKMANVFVGSAISYRTAQLHDRVAHRRPGDRGPAEAEPPDARSLEAQLSQLKRLQNSPDPTVQAATKAVPPTSPSSPKPVLSIVGGLLVGLVLGVGRPSPTRRSIPASAARTSSAPGSGCRSWPGSRGSRGRSAISRSPRRACRPARPRPTARFVPRSARAGPTTGGRRRSWSPVRRRPRARRPRRSTWPRRSTSPDAT